jgi:hypothetical protein
MSPSDRQLLATLLDAIRVHEAKEDVLLILGDAHACRVLVAWSKTDPKWRRPSRIAPPVTATTIARAWAWIVRGWTIDHENIAVIAGVSEARAQEKIDQLVGGRLIYPDGSMSAPAHRALEAHAQIVLGLKPRPNKDPKPNTN